jgi:GH24 family phage-related lysozyme (muramidase)
VISDFRDSDIKFNLQSLMSILRDRNHEGWVLAAYPDPQTSRPLIGAGFGLDVAATEHAQLDPLNPHPFIEPSSTELWQAAGLDRDELQGIVERFHRNLETWGTKRYRRRIRTHSLSPEITEEEATKLLRISAVEAIQNARAYCRGFDQLTAPQQMALSQLVFQMGVNLEEFVQFLSVLNEDEGDRSSDHSVDGLGRSAEHWNSVQRALIESQWARRYASRAASVIAMFDPEYAQNPEGVERRVEAIVRPPVRHHRRRPSASMVRTANVSHLNKSSNKKYKRKVT